MLGKFGMAALFAMVTAAPALAAECSEPIPPAALDGTTASEQQIKDATKDFYTFQHASDDYQSCLLADLEAQKQAAAKAKDPKPLDPSIVAGVNAKIQANQTEKEKVGGELNAAIQAYKAKHPHS